MRFPSVADPHWMPPNAPPGPPALCRCAQAGVAVVANVGLVTWIFVTRFLVTPQHERRPRVPHGWVRGRQGISVLRTSGTAPHVATSGLLFPPARRSPGRPVGAPVACG